MVHEISAEWLPVRCEMCVYFKAYVSKFMAHCSVFFFFFCNFCSETSRFQRGRITLKIGSAASSRDQANLNIFCVLPFFSAWGRTVELQRFVSHLYVLRIFCMGTAVAQWLRCCATNRKVAGSIPSGVSHKILPVALWHWGRLRL